MGIRFPSQNRLCTAATFFKCLLALWFALFTGFACSTARPSTETGVQSEQQTLKEITNLMRRSTRAFGQKDIDTLRGVYADEFRFRLPNGRLLDKNTALEVIRNGSVKINDIRMIEIDLRHLGDFAVVSATVELDAELDGEAFKGTYAGGGSFIRREGKWQIVDEYIGVPVEGDVDPKDRSGK